jgi:hypothetical protein
VVHAYFDSIRPELADKRRHQGGTRWVGCLSCATEGIGEEGNMEVGITLESGPDGAD